MEIPFSPPRFSSSAADAWPKANNVTAAKANSVTAARANQCDGEHNHLSQPDRYRVAVLLGRIKNGRHRPPAHEDVPQAPDAELESYLAALAPEGDVETTGTGRRFGNAQVYQLRLSLMANEALRDLAARADTSPQALAQEWVTQRLAWEAQNSVR